MINSYNYAFFFYALDFKYKEKLLWLNVISFALDDIVVISNKD